MTLLLATAIKVSVILVVALATIALLRRRSAALRHWVLTVALACAALTPILNLMTPAWQVGVGPFTSGGRDRPDRFVVATTAIVQEPADRHPGPAAGATTIGAAPIAPTLAVWLGLVWIGGATVSVAVLCVGLARLRRLAVRARRFDSGRWVDIAAGMRRAAGLRYPVALLYSDHPALLVTWGFTSSSILLPAGAEHWSDERARIVLRHELEHIRRGDWVVQMLGELLRAVYWFNPLIWVACRQLRRESEHACDDAVLGGGVQPTDYAAQLLDLARILNAGRRVPLPAPAMARSSSLEGRITAMLNAHLDRRPLTRSTRIATVVLSLALVLPIAGMAEQRFSTFSGTVVDQTNGLLPDTTLSLTNADRQARHEVRTDRNGHFEFVGLPDGDYALKVQQLGFAPVTEPVTITGRDIDRTFQLQLGSLTETIMIYDGGNNRPSAARPPETPEKTQQRRQKAAEELHQRIAERCSSGGASAIGGNILQPTKIFDMRPKYPERLKDAHIGGVVTMDATIDTDGTVREVRVLQSPDPDLERAAVEAVRQWEFSTTMLNCTPVDVQMRVTATFVAEP
jgi:TonB family protein